MRELWERYKRLPKVERVIIAAFVAVMTHYGATKGTVSYPRTDADVQYFIDAGSYVTNDAVWVSFTTQVVPPAADFIGAARAVDSTNDADWVEFLSGTVGEYSTPQFVPFPNATNYNFQFFTTWTPGPVVHTNGVLTVNWGVAQVETPPELKIAIPVQTEVKLESEDVHMDYTLPMGYDYTYCLESEGSDMTRQNYCWIDPDVLPSTLSKVEIVFQLCSTSTITSLIGNDVAPESSPFLKFYPLLGRYCLRSNGPGGVTTILFGAYSPDVTTIVVDNQNFKCSCNGEDVVRPEVLFYYNESSYRDSFVIGSVGENSAFRFYGFRAWEKSGGMCVDLKPAIGPDGKAVVYDLVKKREVALVGNWRASSVKGGDVIIAPPDPLTGFGGENLLETLNAENGGEE